MIEKIDKNRNNANQFAAFANTNTNNASVSSIDKKSNNNNNRSEYYYNNNHRTKKQNNNKNTPELKSFPKTTNNNNRCYISLILLSTFLHFMNIYIIKPTSTEYVMTLGENKSLTGLILGIITGSSVLSAFIFSHWTNTINIKHSNSNTNDSISKYTIPILCSSITMIVGNILYSSAYATNSFIVMIFGCALTGVGGPCIINRRFVSEYTPRHLRTSGTVLLATVGCIGAALGPLIDMVFHNYISNDGNDTIGNWRVYIFLIGWVDINELNGPGYLMAILWTFYTCIASFMLNEPKINSNNDNYDDNDDEAILLTTKKHKNSLLITNDKDNINNNIGNNDDDDYYYSEDDDNNSNTTLPLFKKLNEENANNNDNNIVTIIQQSSTTTKIILVLTFLTSIISEIIQSSTPIIGYTKYNWDITQIITLNVINLIMVLPISVCIVCWLSHIVNDRDILVLLYPISAVGLLLLIDFKDLVDFLQLRNNDIYWKNSNNNHNTTIIHSSLKNNINDYYDHNDNKYDWLFVVGPVRYSMGNIIVYSSLQACSGILASSLSKVILSKFSKGTYNASFLTTVIGSIGKTCGNIFIIIAGYIDMQHILNLLFIPCFFFGVM